MSRSGAILHALSLKGFALLALLVLAGCAGRIPAPVFSGQPDLALQQRLRAISVWEIDGKLAVRTPQESQSARLQWRQAAAAFDIHLTGPAGLRATHVHGQPGEVIFERGEHRTRAATVEQLSAELIGWPLPARELVDWLRGLPTTVLPVRTAGYNAQGQLVELQQGDWQIRFSGQIAVRDLVLPQRIEAKYLPAHTRPADAVLITLLVKRWDVPAVGGGL